MTPAPQPDQYDLLTADQQALYDEVVERAAEHRGDYAAALVAYARAGASPRDVAAVRQALFGAWRPTSGNAVASLVIGLVAVVVCPVPFLGLSAALYGHHALRETHTGVKSGHGLAIAGLVLGWANTAFWLVLGVVLLVEWAASAKR